MSRKDFEAIAAIVKNSLQSDGGVADEQAFQIAYDMADHFASVNPRFDRERFMNACGL